MSHDLYQEQIMDHYRRPRNKGHLEHPDFKAKESNPLCGDSLELELKLDGNQRVADVRFDGEGCAISQASASILTVAIKGKSLEQVRKLTADDITKMLGVPLSPVRLKCALLSLDALRSALRPLLEPASPPPAGGEPSSEATAQGAGAA